MLMGMAKPMLLALARTAALMPDDLALEVEQRAARVAGVDAGVGLQEVEVAARVEAAARRRGCGPWPRGCRRRRCARGRRGCRWPPPSRRPRSRRSRRAAAAGRSFSSTFSTATSVCLSRPTTRGLELAPVDEADRDVGGVLDDVVVGEQEARRVVDEGGAEALGHHALAARGRLARLLRLDRGDRRIGCAWPARRTTWGPPAHRPGPAAGSACRPPAAGLARAGAGAGWRPGESRRRRVPAAPVPPAIAPAGSAARAGRQAAASDDDERPHASLA